MNKKIVVAILLLCAVLSMGCVDEEEQTYVQKVVEEPIEIPTPKPMSDQPVAKYDFEWYTTNYIGKYFEAPNGYNYAVVTYRIKNDGYNTIYTNPHFWNFEANNVIYNYDSVSHSDEINTITVDIHHNGDVTNKIVFLIPDNIDSGRLRYDPWYGDFTIYRYDSLISDFELTPEPISTPREPKEVSNLTLDDDGFLQWYDNQKIYYRALYVSYAYMSYEESQLESNKSLIQINKFELNCEKNIELQDEFKQFLTILNDMDENNFNSLLDDHSVCTSERQLNKYWKSCISIRRYL